MAHLASVGSHAINGVAAMHSDLLKRTVLRDFYTVAPEKFFNVTNGVTPRRWIVLSNPALTDLITRRIGDKWISDLEDELPRLAAFASDSDFQTEWRAVKADNKQRLAGFIKARTGITVDAGSLFDIQVKRLHEYKRQHLNVLYLITEFNRLRRGVSGPVTPRTVIFGGKAAPGYRMAKLIIKLINAVSAAINQDTRVSDLLKVVFLPDFNVKTSHHVYPAAELSEQISTAGKEASGTGNMKFAMNGALTIGTLDGANVEIRDAVGHENFFLFGLTADEVVQLKAGGYDPRTLLRIEPGTARDARPHRRWLLLRRRPRDVPAAAGFAADARRIPPAGRLPVVRGLSGARQRRVPAPSDWTRMSILNTAGVGGFSSDRSIRDYCRDIWNVEVAGPAASRRG